MVTSVESGCVIKLSKIIWDWFGRSSLISRRAFSSVSNRLYLLAVLLVVFVGNRQYSPAVLNQLTTLRVVSSAVQSAFSPCEFTVRMLRKNKEECLLEPFYWKVSEERTFDSKEYFQNIDSECARVSSIFRRQLSNSMSAPSGYSRRGMLIGALRQRNRLHTESVLLNSSNVFSCKFD